MLLAFVVPFAVMGQTAQDYFKKGLAKHKEKDYAGAIKEYNKAIKEIPNYRDALYNRANCEVMLKDNDAAMADFTRVIEIDPKYAKGYFSRANLLISEDKHQEALPDLNEAVKLDYKLPNLLCTRGQVRGEGGNRNGACADFQKAKILGDPNADEFINQICNDPTPPKKP